jgi:pimeloyl-ACP methyl ester carboxylesterase
MKASKLRNTLAAFSLGVAGLGTVAVSAAAQVSLPPFYEAASKMAPEGKLGKVIKKEEIKTPIPGARAWLIAYISSDIANRKTIATGLVVAPAGEPPKEGRPVVAWAHGTTGTAQNCGPSQVLNPAGPLNEYFLVGGNSWTDYGLPALHEFIKAGYVVVGTDYQGLGGGGKHQYVVSVTQGHDAIDSIRAAGDLKETGAGKKGLIYGWSQGGATVLAAASSGAYVSQKGTAFDGIDIVGFVALAPADIAVLAPKQALTEASSEAMLQSLFKSFSENVFNFTHMAMNLWGTQAAFPDKLQLTDVFTDEGAKAIDEIVSNKCMHSAAGTMNYTYGSGYSSLMKPKPGNAMAWATAMLAGSVADEKPIAPVIIFWGTHDTVVPPVMGALYREQMCKMGANVTRVQLPGEQTHFSTPGASQPIFVPWVADRFAGRPLDDGCSANPS